MDYISEKISRDPVTGRLYVGKKPGDDQAPDATAASSQEPPLSDKELAAIEREKKISKTGTAYTGNNKDQVLDTFSAGLKAGANRRAANRTYDERGVIQKPEATPTAASAGTPTAATTATVASGTPQPEKKGANFSFGGVDPKTEKGFLGVQPGRDPADTFSGKLANLFIPRLDKETGRLYMGTQVGRDPKRRADTASTDTASADTTASATATTAAAGTPTTAASSGSTPKLSAFGAAFKAAREARLSGKGGDTFEFGGKKYHSYQAGEKRPAAGAASAAKPAAPAASAAPAAKPAAPAAASAALAAAVGKMGTEKPTSAQRYDDLVSGAAKGILDNKPTNTSRFYDTKVSTTITKTPGENSTVTTKNDGKTSTVQTSGGGSTQIKLNDKRTKEEIAADEADDAKAREARRAANAAKFGPKTPLGASSNVKESIEYYKESFRAVLAEAANQKFTDYDIERQVSHGLGQEYDRNNPEHKRKADALRKYHQAKGRYVNDAAKPQGTAKPQGAAQPQAASQPQGATRPQGAAQPQGATRPQGAAQPQGASQQTRNNTNSRTDQAAREQAARNSRSAQSQARYRGYGYEAERTAGGGGSRGGGGGGSTPRSTGSPTGGMNWSKAKNWAKTNLTPGNIGRFVAGAGVGGVVGYGTDVATTYFGNAVASKITGTDYNADVAKARGDDLASAALKNVPTGLGWTAGGAVMDKIRRVPVKGNWARGGAVALGLGAGDYITAKTANTPYAPLGRIANKTLVGGGYGAGFGGKPGAGIGAAGGFGVGVGDELRKVKIGDKDVGEYASRGIEAVDKALGYPLTRGIRDQGAEERAKMKAAMDKKRQQNTTVKPESALDRVRRRDQPAGYGVLKRPQ